MIATATAKVVLGALGPKSQRLACGQRLSEQIVKISKVWLFAPSALELGCSQIKAKLGEFVQGDFRRSRPRARKMRRRLMALAGATDRRINNRTGIITYEVIM